MWCSRAVRHDILRWGSDNASKTVCCSHVIIGSSLSCEFLQVPIGSNNASKTAFSFSSLHLIPRTFCNFLNVVTMVSDKILPSWYHGFTCFLCIRSIPVDGYKICCTK